MKLTELAFADGLVLLLKSEEDLKHNLNIWNREMEMRNIKISKIKTKAMKQDKP